MKLPHRLMALLAAVVLLSPAALANQASDLAYAIRFNELSTAMQYLAQGYDANLRDGRGWTMLMIAAERNNLKMVQMLLKNGADASLKNPEGKTAYDLAKSAKVRTALEYAN